MASVRLWAWMCQVCYSWRLLFTLPSSAHVHEFQRTVWTVQHPKNQYVRYYTNVLVNLALNEEKNIINHNNTASPYLRTACPPPLGEVRSRTEAVRSLREQAHRARGTPCRCDPDRQKWFEPWCWCFCGCWFSWL